MTIRRLLPFLAIVLLATAPLSAACEIPHSVQVRPYEPDSRDLLTLRMTGYLEEGCVPTRTSFEVDRDARLLTLAGTRPTTGCEPVDEGTFWEVAAQAGPLEHGDWTLRATLNGNSCVNTTQFSVASSNQQKVGDRLAASLLFPYFQVDLEGGGDGLTTLVAIGNGSVEETLAHVVLWTDRGIPTLAFDVYLPPRAVQTINLRDVFQLGRLPATDPDGAFPGCASPIANPPLGNSPLAALRAQHTGQPHPGDGLCYGSGRRPANIATGFVTVDLANRCSQGLEYPTSLDPDYFGEGDTGLAASANLLYGDYFYVDVAGAHAQGFEAVPLVADAELGDGDETFYTAGAILHENRVPLPGRYRTRFLSGGAFEGNTEVVIWRWDWNLWESAEYGPRDCSLPEPGVSDCMYLNLTLYDESGGLLGEDSLPEAVVTGIYEIGGEDVPVGAPFGSVVLENLELGSCYQIPTGFHPRSAWVTPLLSAEGGYSVGFRAIPID